VNVTTTCLQMKQKQAQSARTNQRQDIAVAPYSDLCHVLNTWVFRHITMVAVDFAAQAFY